MREAAIVRKIIAAVRQRYPHAWCRKLADRYSRGLPDILIVVQCSGALGDGHSEEWSGTLFVETKTVDGVPSKIQEAELDEIRRAGAEAIVATSAQEVIDKLKDMGAIN